MDITPYDAFPGETPGHYFVRKGYRTLEEIAESRKITVEELEQQFRLQRETANRNDPFAFTNETDYPRVNLWRTGIDALVEDVEEGDDEAKMMFYFRLARFIAAGDTNIITGFLERVLALDEDGRDELVDKLEDKLASPATE
jgi:hypothetical protein